jgi:hypothetical protein
MAVQRTEILAHEHRAGASNSQLTEPHGPGYRMVRTALLVAGVRLRRPGPTTGRLSGSRLGR